MVRKSERLFAIYYRERLVTPQLYRNRELAMLGRREDEDVIPVTVVPDKRFDVEDKAPRPEGDDVA